MNMTRIRQICLRLSKLKKTDYIVILLVGVLLLIVVLPVKEDKNTYVLTKADMALSDYLGPQLISSKVKGRMKEWENKFFTEGI